MGFEKNREMKKESSDIKEAGEELDWVDSDLNLPRFAAWNWVSAEQQRRHDRQQQTASELKNWTDKN